jgi:SAM-dependent methyltransferase
MSLYDAAFYRYQNRNSRHSAQVVCDIILRWIDVKSVTDFGCGQGVWLSEWKAVGALDVIGLDGDYVDRDELLITMQEFRGTDLRQPIDLGRTFDLVQSLEVAEHLPEACADTFVDSLVRHGTIVLFSAAMPGQLGENHVNEQPYSYWRDKFAARGYALLDAVRPILNGNRGVMFYYRYNCMLFVRQDRLASLPAELRATRVPDDVVVPTFTPLWFRCVLKCASILPNWFGQWLALLDKRVSNYLRS